ncbi:MAG TPA: ParA family protein [Pyrinomonadaceae bacterium]|jgi:chromosome partitioning protein|nr:ParA family protein [Pyrinomonadaceae bacterium]
MKTIAIANQKGGVGKTTTAVNLGAGLAIEGYRVLMIDLDSQCNLTRTFLSPEMIQNTLANVLIDNKVEQLPFQAAIYETHIENLDLAASHIRLARLEKSGQFDDLFRLKDALASLSAEYDFVLIDCPPSLGVVVTQALLASDNVLIPVAAEYYAFEGTQDLEETVKSVRRSNPALNILGYIVTRFDARTTASADAYAQAKTMFGDRLFETLIRSNTHLIAAPAYRQSIFEYAQTSRGSEDYLNFTHEFLSRLEMTSKVRLLREKRK